MIGMLKGKVWEIQSDKLILDVNGVGYQVSIPYGFLTRLKTGQETTVYTHVIMREDELSLYGFSSMAEKELFLQMLTVSGIGPKAALSILSTLGSAQAESAIAGENLTLLTKVPGIGKKTAQRLILELKEKFKGKALIPTDDGMNIEQVQSLAISEAMETLLALGFSQDEAKSALKAVEESAQGENKSVEDQVRLALRAIGAQKG